MMFVFTNSIFVTFTNLYVFIQKDVLFVCGSHGRARHMFDRHNSRDEKNSDRLKEKTLFGQKGSAYRS